MNLTTDKKLRKEQPIARGVLDYFGNAIAEVARVSYIGNRQHNGDAPMHWARERSTDHADCIARHLIERGTLDDDGLRHSAKAAWRALALLQLEIEEHANRSNNNCDVGVAPEPAKPRRQPSPEEVVAESPGVVGFEEQEADNIREMVGLAIGELQFFAISNRQQDAERMFSIGCPPLIARQIMEGTAYPSIIEKNDLPYCYVTGPMRGIEQDNFPAFDKARSFLLREGWNVISPADIDRACNHKHGQYENADVYFDRDIYAIRSLRPERGDAIAVLPGWENSTGAPAEVFDARWRGLRIIDATTGKNLDRLDPDSLIRSFSAYLMRQFSNVEL